MFLVTIWLWCQERWETGIQRWHVAPGLSHGCTLCNNCNNALLSWSCSAPASLCCSHFCLALWSWAAALTTGVVSPWFLCVLCCPEPVENGSKEWIGIPGLSCVSFKFMKGFVHPWAEQCLEALNMRASRALLIIQRGWVERKAKDWPWGIADNICGALQFPLDRQLLSQGAWA